MKKPTFQCATTIATVITPIIPAAASGVSKPSAISTPLPISVVAARRACHMRPAHADAVEPAGRAAEPARPEELVVAVVGEEQPEHDAQDQQAGVELVHGTQRYGTTTTRRHIPVWSDGLL